MGETRLCRTAHEPFPGSEDGKLYWLGSRLADHEAQRGEDQIICECELMPRRKLEELLARRPSATFDDVRRQLRLGMGPCQGGFCSYRTTGIAHELGCVNADRANMQLRSFLEHRWIGLHPILYGDQVRQTALDDWIFQGLLDVEHLPDAAPA